MQSVGNQQYNDAHAVKLTGTNAYCTLITPDWKFRRPLQSIPFNGQFVLSVPLTDM